MHIARIFVFLYLLILIGCASEKQKPVLSDPGFGVTAVEIQAGAEDVEIPVYLKYDEPVKGIQFTLVWDAAKVEVSKPILLDTNPSFTVSNNEPRNGQMKVLIFSMQGNILDVSDPEVFRLPLKLIDKEAPEVELRFENAVFAGPSASSYDIPITHAKIKIVP